MNKYKLLILICFFLITITLPKVTASVNSMNLLGKVIILDSGHGGVDAGATGNQIIEKDLNLILTRKLEKELVSRGATVYLTREDDKDLSTTTVNRKRSDLYNRAKYINKISPNMYISIHLNSVTNSSWRGLQVFYTTKSEENKLIAETITNHLRKNMSNVREIKKDNGAIKLNVEMNSGKPVPEWLEKDAEKLSGKVVRLASREDVDIPVEEHLIVELYSK